MGNFADDHGLAKRTNTNNFAIGTAAGSQLDTATTCTFVGSTAGQNQASGVSNVAVGSESLKTAIASSFCTAIGVNSLQLATGSRSTSVGYKAGDDITTGTDNICMGFQARAGTAGATNRIVIGANISGTADNQFSFGLSANVVSNDFGTDALWSRISDERFKENIDDYSLGLDFITALRVVSYNWRDGYGDTTYKVNGLIAQEVEEALQGIPFNGHTVGDDEEKTQKLKLEAFILPLINSVKELTARVAELEGKA